MPPGAGVASTANRLAHIGPALHGSDPAAFGTLFMRGRIATPNLCVARAAQQLSHCAVPLNGLPRVTHAADPYRSNAGLAPTVLAERFTGGVTLLNVPDLTALAALLVLGDVAPPRHCVALETDYMSRIGPDRHRHHLAALRTLFMC